MTDGNESLHWGSKAAAAMIAESEDAAYMTVLDGNSDPVPIRVLRASERTLEIGCAAQVVLGSPVRIDWQSCIVLAEVTGNQTPGFLELHVRHSIDAGDLSWIENLWR
jgi:hypothetical protein